MSRSSHFPPTAKALEHSGLLAIDQEHPATQKKAEFAASPPGLGAQLGASIFSLSVKIERLLVEGSPHEIRASRITVEALRKMARDAQLGFEAQLRCSAGRQMLDHRLGQMCARF